MGLKPFDWIQTINVPQIPKLAQGSVVPPNSEFMAILGDNTQEHEVVSPVSTMKQAFKEAMQEIGMSNGGNITIVAEGEAGLMRFIKFKLEEEDRRQGASLSNRVVVN